MKHVGETRVYLSYLQVSIVHKLSFKSGSECANTYDVVKNDESSRQLNGVVDAQRSSNRASQRSVLSQRWYEMVLAKAKMLNIVLGKN